MPELITVQLLRIRHDQRIAAAAHGIADHPHDFFRLTGIAHRDAAGLDDAAFLPRDLPEGIAQVRRVVVRYGRDDADERTGDHIGRVQPSAHARFDHRDVAGTLGEPVKRAGG